MRIRQEVQEVLHPQGPKVKAFGVYEKVEGLRPCRKRPVIVAAMQMEEAFRVDTLEGDAMLGKPGDYLMRGVADELYPCDRDVFERSHDFV